MTRHTRTALVAAVLIFAASFEAEKVNAETNLVEICTEGTTLTSGECPHTRRAWVRPAPGDYVNSCTELSAEECVWGASRYRLWESLAPDDLVWTCALDIAVGFMPEGLDPCGSASEDKPRVPKSEVEQGFIGSAGVSWTHPTEYTDGSALPLEEIGNTAIFYERRCDMAQLEASQNMDIIDAPENAHRVENLPHGPWCFAARTATVDGETSDLSNTAETLVEPEPGSPLLELFTAPAELVTVEDIAYSSRKEADQTVMQPVGTVPIGTACIMSEAVLAQGELFWGIAAAAVTWAGSVEPVQVYGRCAEP